MDKQNKCFKNLGVWITNNLSPLDEEMITKLITSLIQPKLEYAAFVWSPNKVKDIKKLERLQSSYKNGSKFTV